MSLKLHAFHVRSTLLLLYRFRMDTGLYAYADMGLHYPPPLVLCFNDDCTNWCPCTQYSMLNAATEMMRNLPLDGNLGWGKHSALMSRA